MGSSVLNEHSFDVSLNQRIALMEIDVKTVIKGNDVEITVYLGKPVNEYSVQELFKVIETNFDVAIESLNLNGVTDEDINKIHRYLFTATSHKVREIIQDRWLSQCNKGRVYCGECLDLAIAPIGGIYRNSKSITDSDDLGSWEEMFSLDALKGKSAREVADHIIFDLNYAQWLFSEEDIIELAELFTKEKIIYNPMEKPSKFEKLQELLSEEMKLNQIIFVGTELSVEEKEVLIKERMARILELTKYLMELEDPKKLNKNSTKAMDVFNTGRK